MRVISIANQKGGVGKTTTAVNLSAGLARAGKKVLLIDMDPQGQASTFMGIDSIGEDLLTVGDLLLKPELKPEDIIVSCEEEAVDIIPGDIRLAAMVKQISALKGSEYKLQRKLSQVKGYDFVIIDCPPTFGCLPINALLASKEVIMPLKADYASLLGAQDFVNELDSINSDLGAIISHETKVCGILFTFFDQRTNVSKEIVEAVRKLFPKKIFKTSIPSNIRLVEAQTQHKSIFAYDDSSKGAKAYQDFVKELTRSRKGVTL